jgi:RNA polymerase sigma-70 factor (ECF subfamily)
VPTQQQEFECIALPHLAALLRVARRLTFDLTTAEDLVQQTMLLAWRGFRGFRAGTNARAWLFRILFNEFHGQGRKAALTERRVPFEDRVQSGLQAAAEIGEALDALAVEQRSALMLCVVEGFTCREAAEILDVPIGTVMSRLSRARDEMRKALKPLAKEAYK